MTITGLGKRTKKGNTMSRVIDAKQQHLITAIGRINPKSAEDLAKSNLTESELKNLRSTKWTDLNLEKKQVKMMQLAKVLVTRAIAERVNNQNDYNFNRTARQNSHADLFETNNSHEAISDDELSNSQAA